MSQDRIVPLTIERRIAIVPVYSDLTCPPQPGPTSGTVYRGWTMEGMIDGKATIQRGADHSQVA
ncbi:MAG: hypothetical protein U0640_14740 [Phycisphaerales bacterium]